MAAGNSQSSTPRLLFVSNVLPGSFGVGSIYLRDLLSETDPDSVAFFSSTPSLPGESFTGTVFKDSFPQIGRQIIESIRRGERSCRNGHRQTEPQVFSGAFAACDLGMETGSGGTHPV